MLHKNKVHPGASAKATGGTRKEKPKLHPRNKHRERYDFKQLIDSCPGLAQFVKLNIYNDQSIDFLNPEAVKMLNRALLKHYYDIGKWNIPNNYLCPPIPGRADYIHHIADLLGSKNNNKIPTGNKIICLDIGVGANCVYPIIELNPVLKGEIKLKLQQNPKDIFYGVIKKAEAVEVETIPMGQGNKKSRIIAWTFLTRGQQKIWMDTRWNEL